MANEPTPKQQAVIRALLVEYGTPDKVAISAELDGVVRMDWCEQKRHLFIKKDGERVFWRLVD